MVWCTVLTSFVVSFVLLATAPAAEFGTDRPSLDYKSFDLPRPDHTLCEKSCDADRFCRAWTYVRPGVAGRAARCRLKSVVSQAARSTCCISGVTAGDDGTTVTGEIQRQLTILGYEPGPIDGHRGSRTRDAIMRFQADHRLPIHGQITSGLITVLGVVLREKRAGQLAGAERRSPKAVGPGQTLPDASD